jgi:hypothetical protein
MLRGEIHIPLTDPDRCVMHKHNSEIIIRGASPAAVALFNAAPELLASCNKALSVLHDGQEGIDEVNRLLSEAVAKAEGRA